MIHGINIKLKRQIKIFFNSQVQNSQRYYDEFKDGKVVN